jgi:hypothetical protein
MSEEVQTVGKEPANSEIYWCLLTNNLTNVFRLIYRVRRVASAANGSNVSVRRSAAALTIVTY